MNWHIGRLVQTFPIRALAVLALAFGAGSATAVDDLGLFELESNAAQNGPLPGAEDWETLYAGGANTGGSSNAFTGIIADPAPQSIFTGGRKDIQEIEQWGWKDGSVPDKNDITNAYAAAYDDNGDLILYFGADRVSNNGDAFLGFWFFKGVVGLGRQRELLRRAPARRRARARQLPAGRQCRAADPGDHVESQLPEGGEQQPAAG
jgi:hypothetical protein